MNQYFETPNLSGDGTHRIAYSDKGNKTSPTCFCVHGLTRNHHDFDWLGDRLVDAGYRVIAPTMLGRGESQYAEAPVMEYSYPAYVADCIALLDALKIDSAHWLGTSMGGIIGMMMACFSLIASLSIFNVRRLSSRHEFYSFGAA